MLFRGDEVLVVREKKEGGEKLLWSDLGGKVEAKESLLDCALRELAEEAEGFLSAGSIALLECGLRQRFGDGHHSPEVVALNSKGARPQAVAVFPMDCSGLELDLLSPAQPNSFGVHEIHWMSRSHPDLRNPKCTRWPLFRALCGMRSAGSRADGQTDAASGRPTSVTSTGTPGG
ncbi:unnamed protein product, partial [Polarella glacialis]